MKVLFAVLALLVASAACADPDVTNISGTVSPDSSITIVGTGFGTKSPAAPVMYDNFQDGTPGNTLSEVGSPGWDLGSEIGGYEPKYSDAQPRFSGDITARQWFGDTGGSGFNFNCQLGITIPSGDIMYVSGWSWHTRSASGPTTGCRNWKIWFIAKDSYWQDPTERWDLYDEGNPSSSNMSKRNCNGDEIYPSGGGTPPTRSQWNRLEVYHRRGGGSLDYRMWQNFELDGQQSGTDFGCGGFNSMNIMHYYTGDNGNDPEMTWHWGELYVDITPARVEIGNAATWDDCTHREIQIPTAWSATSVTVDVNVGTYSTDETAWVYVVNADETVNTNGRLITIGLTEETQLITSPPTNLLITGGN